MFGFKLNRIKYIHNLADAKLNNNYKPLKTIFIMTIYHLLYNTYNVIQYYVYSVKFVCTEFIALGQFSIWDLQMT